ncbi:MAG: PfkB family carbohydrate kinase [Candidatus Omnitrophica bacterium]|nr:PfkB family carbohydrate kinase [Candidatus Omnitrophota bacterium]
MPKTKNAAPVLMVGSVALDSIKTAKADKPRLLGGSASHAALAASFFAPVQLVGIVGDDFPKSYLQLYQRHGIDLAGLQVAHGKTFHWAGEYEVDMNRRRTLRTELGVFASFSPQLPDTYVRTPFVLLGNIAPSLQHHVLDQMRNPRLVVADTMDLWLNTALGDLLKLLRRIDVLVINDTEACQLANESNVITAAARIHRLGPKYVIVKKGEHGAILSTPAGLFLAPAVPLKKVVDPTGAGDSFAGGFLGYLASCRGPLENHLRRAVIYGTVVASFCCEGFGLSGTARATRAMIEERVRALEKLVRF